MTKGKQVLWEEDPVSVKVIVIKGTGASKGTCGAAGARTPGAWRGPERDLLP